MKKNVIGISLCAFALGFCINSFAVSAPDTQKAFSVAVVDVQKVVTSSSQVNELKEEQKRKIADLTKFVQQANDNIAKETDAAKKKGLEDKANKELAAKKEAIEKEYVAKLSGIDKSISGVISKYAKEKNYDLVLAKSTVLHGGQDITAEIAKAVK